jgi:hypothetical protein
MEVFVSSTVMKAHSAIHSSIKGAIVRRGREITFPCNGAQRIEGGRATLSLYDRDRECH